METINIKGKDYVTVNARLLEFRKQHPNWTLTTSIIHWDDKDCVMQATILDESGRTIANGTAWENKDMTSSMVNKTSYVENCETSAWGRCLANLGIGILDNVCSADEVVRAIEQGDKITKQPTSDKDLEYARNVTLKYGDNAGKKLGELTQREISLLANGSNEYLRKHATTILKAMDEGKINFEQEEITEEAPF